MIGGVGARRCDLTLGKQNAASRTASPNCRHPATIAIPHIPKIPQPFHTERQARVLVVGRPVLGEATRWRDSTLGNDLIGLPRPYTSPLFIQQIDRLTVEADAAFALFFHQQLVQPAVFLAQGQIRLQHGEIGVEAQNPAGDDKTRDTGRE